MATRRHAYDAMTQGHVAVYAQDGRWRRAVARSLGEAGHSFAQAASPAEIQQTLAAQRYDVLAMKIRDEQDAREVAGALAGVRLPLHTILVGSASALPLTGQRRRGGTFRYVPGPVTAHELSRLVDLSISAGGWDEGATENGDYPQLEHVELEETIERAAATVYRLASKKRQRFRSEVVGPGTHAYADPAKLRHALTTLLRLIVAVAPYRALISVEAQAGGDEWLIRINASNGRSSPRRTKHVADALREEMKTLSAVSRALKEQGGMLWVELLTSAAPAFSLTLPLPPESVSLASA